MAETRRNGVLRHIHRLVGNPNGHGWSDAQLLQCFLANRDEQAFRVLVERHGRMVLSVCRHVLRQAQDAEDAFQATFLVLAQSAAKIRHDTSLASWLYGVAYRTALKARIQMSKRRRHESRAGKVTHTGPELELAWQELQAVLAEEVNGLSEKHRAPFVLCCLEGLSKNDAARQLGWKEGTLSGRLAEARKLLQQRLARRGLTLATALCAGAWDANALTGASDTLIHTTVQAALGAAAEPVAALAAGLTPNILLSRGKLAGFLILVTGLVAGGAGIHLHRASATPPAAEPSVSPARQTQKVAAAKAPPQTKKDSIILRGRVLDPDGNPLADARVFVPRTASAEDEHKGPLGEKTTGPDGRFRLTLDRTALGEGRFLIAAADGYGIDWLEAGKLGDKEITLRLVKDVPVAGRVLDLQGRPIPGVSVRVSSIESPPEGDLTPVLQSIRRDGDRLFAHPMRSIPGVAIIPPMTTDAAGRFRIKGLGRERLATLRVEGPTIEHKTLYVLTRPGVDAKKLLKAARLTTIYGPTFDHLAGPTKPIAGIVRDRATGKPLADAYVQGSIGSWWDNVIRSKTDKDGRYRLIGLPKTASYRVFAYAERQGYLVSGKTVGDSEGLGPIALHFDLARGVRVRGRVTDKSTGKPVPSGAVYVPLADNKHFAALPGANWYKDNLGGFHTDKDGYYDLLALPGLGLILLRAEVEGENSYVQVALDPADRPKADLSQVDGLGECFVSAGSAYMSLITWNAYRLIDPAPDAGSLTCDIQLERALTRSGKVVDPNGKPLTGVCAFGLTMMGGVKTLADSSFKAVDLNPARPRRVAFFHKERQLVGHVLLGADTKEPVTVRLRPGAVLTGRVLGADGKPLAGARVTASYPLNPGRWLPKGWGDADVTIQTDAEGRFRMEGVFPGLRFRLEIRRGDAYFDIDEKHKELTLTEDTKNLGDITAKTSRP